MILDSAILAGDDERSGNDRRLSAQEVPFDRRVNGKDRRIAGLGEISLEEAIRDEASPAQLTSSQGEHKLFLRRTEAFGNGIIKGVCKSEVFGPQDDLNLTQQYLLRLYMRERVKYVNKMGWFKEPREYDDDVYDLFERTRYILSPTYNRDGTLRQLGGMRLTQVPSFTNSLTWSMLRNNPELEESALRDNQHVIDLASQAALKGKLWDLTRLVVSGGGSDSLRAKTVFELIGTGLAETCEDLDYGTVWYFFTTQEFQKFLTDAGILHRVMARIGTGEHGKEDSILCITRPAIALEHLRVSQNKREQYAYRVIEHARQATMQPVLD